MIERILRTVNEEEKNMRLKRAVLGLGYIAAEIDGGKVGLSANIFRSNMSGCSVFKNAGTLAGSCVGDILELGRGSDLIARALAIATINALKNTKGSSRDIFDIIDPKVFKRVAMVGYIGPVAQMLSNNGCEVSVFENRPLSGPFFKPKEAMPEVFAAADAIIITATSIINDTIGEILALDVNTEMLVLMGPSTPLIVESFRETGIRYLAGANVVDGDVALRIVMEGGGTQELYRYGAMEKTIREIA